MVFLYIFIPGFAFSNYRMRLVSTIQQQYFEPQHYAPQTQLSNGTYAYDGYKIYFCQASVFSATKSLSQQQCQNCLRHGKLYAQQTVQKSLTFHYQNGQLPVYAENHTDWDFLSLKRAIVHHDLDLKHNLKKNVVMIMIKAIQDMIAPQL